MQTHCSSCDDASKRCCADATELANEIQLRLTEDSWTQLVQPKIATIIDGLKPNSVMDCLRARGILSRDEYAVLLTVKLQRGRSRQLVGDILPRKGLVGLRSLCEILLQSKDQRYIVSDIIFSETASEHSRSGPLALSSTTPSEMPCDQTVKLEAEFDKLHFSEVSTVLTDRHDLEATKNEPEQVTTTGIQDGIQGK